MYGLDSQSHALPGHWHSMLRDAIVITGHTTPSMSYREFLERIVSALSYEEHGALESVIMDALDHVTAENAMDIAGMMCGINGVPIEARWHAAESFCGAEKMLCNMCTNREVHRRLGDILFAQYLK